MFSSVSSGCFFVRFDEKTCGLPMDSVVFEALGFALISKSPCKNHIPPMQPLCLKCVCIREFPFYAPKVRNKILQNAPWLWVQKGDPKKKYWNWNKAK